MSDEVNSNPLPREVAPGLFWLGDCTPTWYEGELLHMYISVFLIKAEKGAILIEAGLPLHLDTIQRQLDLLLEDDNELKYIWLTHQETPHAGGVGRMLQRYPSAQVVGDIRDYHLYFPHWTHRFSHLGVGDSIDLGDTKFLIEEAVIKDLITTQWAVDTKRRALFAGDGFAFSHYHFKEQCGHFAEEVGDELDIPKLTGVFAEFALYWWKFADLDPYVRSIETLLERHSIDLVLPTHGLPLSDVEKTVPLVMDGLIQGSKDFSVR